MYSKEKVRAIAIYLPQFHPIPENDNWWGAGFTEWTNVKKANPVFRNHYQPHIPAELGYYNLLDNNVFHKQISLACKYGIHGFMFYEYWFQGKRLLEKPIENYLEDNSIDFPYFLCWANENWTRRWDGMEREVLLQQTYSIEDFSNHFDRVYSRHFLSSKYIKVGNRPVLAIYKADIIPNLSDLVSLWRSKTKELGFEDLYLIYCDSTGKSVDFTRVGFDASYEFQPNWDISFKYRRRRYLIESRRFNRLVSILNKLISKGRSDDIIIDYEKYSSDEGHFMNRGFKQYPCIMPSWDNSPRRKNGGAVIFCNSSPKAYEDWLRRILAKYEPYSEEENFLFINAWNEWAEGAHLEPCLKWGKTYLETTYNVLNSR